MYLIPKGTRAIRIVPSLSAAIHNHCPQFLPVTIPISFLALNRALSAAHWLCSAIRSLSSTSHHPPWCIRDAPLPRHLLCGWIDLLSVCELEQMNNKTNWSASLPPIARWARLFFYSIRRSAVWTPRLAPIQADGLAVEDPVWRETARRVEVLWMVEQ